MRERFGMILAIAAAAWIAAVMILHYWPILWAPPPG
jgi:hypothetical protein